MVRQARLLHAWRPARRSPGARLAAADIPEGLPDLIQIQRFPDELPRTQLVRSATAVRRARHQNHGNPGERPVVELCGSEMRAVHDGQHQVEQDEAGVRVRPQVVQGFAALTSQNASGIAEERSTPIAGRKASGTGNGARASIGVRASDAPKGRAI